MEETYKQSLVKNLAARKAERKVLDKQISDLEKLIKEAPATKAKAKPAAKPKTAKPARKSSKTNGRSKEKKSAKV
jgi:hypothetical protein